MVCRGRSLCKGPEAGPSLVCLSPMATPQLLWLERRGGKEGGDKGNEGAWQMEQDLVALGEDLGFAQNEEGAMESSVKRRDMA